MYDDYDNYSYDENYTYSDSEYKYDEANLTPKSSLSRNGKPFGKKNLMVTALD